MKKAAFWQPFSDSYFGRYGKLVHKSNYVKSTEDYMKKVTPIMVLVDIQSTHISQSELHEITLSLSQETRNESGCISYNCYQNFDDDGVSEVILFKSIDAHTAHMNSQHVMNFLNNYRKLDLKFQVKKCYL